jgi:hypothetical protein
MSKTKVKKNITVYIEDVHETVYLHVQGVTVEDCGALVFLDSDGDKHFLSPAIRWHAYETPEVQS